MPTLSQTSDYLDALADLFHEDITVKDCARLARISTRAARVIVDLRARIADGGAIPVREARLRLETVADGHQPHALVAARIGTPHALTLTRAREIARLLDR